MNIMFLLIGVSLLAAITFLLLFIWAVKSGQYDDLDGPAQRILMDDDDPMIPFNQHKPQAQQIEADQTKPNKP